MCGIAGWLIKSGTAPADKTLHGMCEALAHRGPDQHGEFIEAVRNESHQLAMGHRRLSIIDLSPDGDQPMHTPDDRFIIVFNGEIYNYIELREELIALGHAFRSSSDTEVLLAAYRQWGLEALPRLRGMFAFALWDRQNEELVLARDPFGKKPLYIYESESGLAFSSEINSLLKFPGVKRQIDWNSVNDFLIYRYVPGPNTLFRNIKKLTPGSYSVWKNGSNETVRYFIPPDQKPFDPTTVIKDPETAFFDTLEEAVQIRMRSDAPYGAYLSGGIDSSAIVALMSRHSTQPVKTFAVGFEEAKFSELEFSRQVATKFKTDHHELVVRSDDIMQHLDHLVLHRGAPVSESSDIPIYLLSMEAAKSVKMVLTGEGADEILAGYPKHWVEAYIGTYQTLVPQVLHNRLLTPLINTLPYGARRLKILARTAGIHSYSERMENWFGAISHRERTKLFHSKAINRPPDQLPFTASDQRSFLRSVLFFDQTSWLPDNLLERGDRMLMAASIEGRMPFMDVKLAQLVSSLPDNQRMGGVKGKTILRKVMTGVLPDEILIRKKVGFRVPINEWFRTTMKDYLHDLLGSQNSNLRSYLDNKVLDTYLTEHWEGRQNHEKLLWALINLELFHRTFRLKL